MLGKINKLLEVSWFPISFRFITLAAFIGLVIIGFSSPTDDPFFNSQLSKTNLTSSFIWRLWWPLIVLSAIFLGRAWCLICPVEMVTTFFSKAGFRMKRPKWILSGWVITIFYLLVLVIGITIIGIDMNPKYTSYYLLVILGIAILTGILFEKNTFCRYVCPVGYVLGIFSKLSAWGWRVRKEEVCSSCSDKSCINSRYTYNLNYKSCGVDLVPANIDTNSQCILCSGCLKTCKTYKSTENSSRPNPAFVKIGFATDLLQLQPVRIVEWAFLFILTGSMIFELGHFQVISNWSTILSTPEAITGLLNLNEGSGKEIFLIFYMYFLLPAIAWLLPYLYLKIFNIPVPSGSYLKYFSIIFLPVIAAFFAGLVIMEIATRIPYYKYIVSDIRGVETIKAMLFKQIEMPQSPGWAHWAYIVILLFTLVGGLLVSLKVVKKLSEKWQLHDKRTHLYFLPLLFTITVLAAAII